MYITFSLTKHSNILTYKYIDLNGLLNKDELFFDAINFGLSVFRFFTNFA